MKETQSLTVSLRVGREFQMTLVAISPTVVLNPADSLHSEQRWDQLPPEQNSFPKQ